MKRPNRPKRITLAGPIELDMLLHTDPRKLRIVRKRGAVPSPVNAGQVAGDDRSGDEDDQDVV